ncbi:hypothetical protein RI662_16935 [Brevibacillus agri]|uniref:hypothetical protein n=1 Tax=Brevibacillus agri TaxID=51101 RepID=UPI0002A517A7|nr:hypothetical protein [Brevibacillus agri]ELK41910.1 hypothetical protein D478_11582 [Brevibacillus agri BAB-2500]MDR9505958.1 hypothetical protein [Brevibacillus agri]
MNLLKNFLLLLLILVGISGCGGATDNKEENSSVTENPISKQGSAMIGAETIKLYELSGNQNLKDQFKFAFDPKVPQEIKYYKNGETVTIDFGETVYDNITILDILLNSKGEQLYTDKEIKNVAFTRIDNKYQFKLEKHFASALNSNDEPCQTVYRGFRINAYKDDKEYPFGFVIKTDAY